MVNSGDNDLDYSKSAKALGIKGTNSSQIDWGYWKNIEAVEIKVAVLLAYNIDPETNSHLDSEQEKLSDIIYSKRRSGQIFTTVPGDHRLVFLSEVAAMCISIEHPISDKLRALAKLCKPEIEPLKLESKNVEPPIPEKILQNRERDGLLNIIYAMLEFMKKELPGCTQNQIIDFSEDFGYHGLKKSTMEKHFGEANRIHERYTKEV